MCTQLGGGGTTRLHFTSCPLGAKLRLQRWCRPACNHGREQSGNSQPQRLAWADVSEQASKQASKEASRHPSSVGGQGDGDGGGEWEAAARDQYVDACFAGALMGNHGGPAVQTASTWNGAIMWVWDLASASDAGPLLCARAGLARACHGALPFAGGQAPRDGVRC